MDTSPDKTTGRTPSSGSRYPVVRRLLIVGLALLAIGSIYAQIRSWVDDAHHFLDSRQLSPDATNVAVNWVHRLDGTGLAGPIIIDTLVLNYVPHNFAGSLTAFDLSTGAVRWETSIQSIPHTLDSLLYKDKMIYATTIFGVDAYDSETGKALWSTQLGSGHVANIAQLEDSALRVYYGEHIYYLDYASGQVIKQEPLPAPAWIAGGIAIYHLANNQMKGVEYQTGRPLWETSGRPFSVDSVMPPVSYDAQTLIVGTYSGGICALDLNTGAYDWCRPEVYKSKVAIDSATETGYILRDDFALVALNLRTGSVLREIKFLPNQLPENMQKYGYQYFVTADHNQVLLLLGDSQELFSLTLK